MEQISQVDYAYQDVTLETPNFPRIIWILIAKSLGIKRYIGEKPIVALVLYICTLASAFSLVSSSIWYTVYNIFSVYTKDDILIGIVTVTLTIGWTSMGLYANNLAYKLFSHSIFLSMVRFHSKTILKVNAAFFVWFLSSCFIILNNVNAYGIGPFNACAVVNLEAAVCIIRYSTRVTFSFFFLFWNMLVAVVMISTCRTHTIGIRKFIYELELDSQSYNVPIKNQDISLCISNLPMESTVESDHPELTMTPSGIEMLEDLSSSLGEQQMLGKMDITHALRLRSEDILHKYWKLSEKLRVSSIALQRWVMSLIALTLAWTAVYLVYWISAEATLIDVGDFVLPLLILPLLISAYAEVNNEGLRVTKCIYPSVERLNMLFYLLNAPLQMTVYGYPLTHKTIMTGVTAVMLAFASKILFRIIGSDL